MSPQLRCHLLFCRARKEYKKKSPTGYIGCCINVTMGTPPRMLSRGIFLKLPFLLGESRTCWKRRRPRDYRGLSRVPCQKIHTRPLLFSFFSSSLPLRLHSTVSIFSLAKICIGLHTLTASREHSVPECVICRKLAAIKELTNVLHIPNIGISPREKKSIYI